MHICTMSLPKGEKFTDCTLCTTLFPAPNCARHPNMIYAKFCIVCRSEYACHVDFVQLARTALIMLLLISKLRAANLAPDRAGVGRREGGRGAWEKGLRQNLRWSVVRVWYLDKNKSKHSVNPALTPYLDDSVHTYIMEENNK